jgi:hypothetical protein
MTALISMLITTNAYLGQVSLLFLVIFPACLPGGCSRRLVLAFLIYSLLATFDNNYDNSLANYYLNNNNNYYSSFFYDFYDYHDYTYYYYYTFLPDKLVNDHLRGSGTSAITSYAKVWFRF